MKKPISLSTKSIKTSKKTKDSKLTNATTEFNEPNTNSDVNILSKNNNEVNMNPNSSYLENNNEVNMNSNSSYLENNNEVLMQIEKERSVNVDLDDSQVQFISSDLLEFEKVKSINKKAFEKLIREYNNTLKKLDECKLRIQDYKTQIKDRSKKVKSEIKGEANVIVNLTSGEINILRTKIKELQLEVQQLKKIKKTQSDKIKIDSRKERDALTAKMRNNNKKINIEKTAFKNLNYLEKVTDNLLIKFKDEDPEKFLYLLKKAREDKKLFQTHILKLFNEFLNNENLTKVIDNTPKIQSKIINAIIEKMFYKK